MSEKLVTKGIVLRATATKEADYILNILTDSLGQIAVVARGARRKGSRIAAGSELLAFSELVLYQRGNWYYLDEASTISLFDGIRQDIELLSLASYFAEMTECVTAEDEPVPEILSLLAELRAEKPVWVELGLQTIHASTAAYIRRGYPLSVFDDAVQKLHSLFRATSRCSTAAPSAARTTRKSRCLTRSRACCCAGSARATAGAAFCRWTRARSRRCAMCCFPSRSGCCRFPSRARRKSALPQRARCLRRCSLTGDSKRWTSTKA